MTDGMSVGEAARVVGVSIDTLRYYEREELRRAAGRRAGTAATRPTTWTGSPS